MSNPKEPKPEAPPAEPRDDELTDEECDGVSGGTKKLSVDGLVGPKTLAKTPLLAQHAIKGR
jgi:hypothetical protein